MNKIESWSTITVQELNPKRAGRVTLVGFTARFNRSAIVGITGIFSNPDAIPTSEFPIELPNSDAVVKKNKYKPSKRVNEYVDKFRRLEKRIRRKSRCDGAHDPKENPCGSPRCRTKHRQRLNVQSANPRRKESKPVGLKSRKNPFYTAA